MEFASRLSPSRKDENGTSPRPQGERRVGWADIRGRGGAMGSKRAGGLVVTMIVPIVLVVVAMMMVAIVLVVMATHPGVGVQHV